MAHAHLGEQIEQTLGRGGSGGLLLPTRRNRPGHSKLQAVLPGRCRKLGVDPFLVVNGDVFCDVDFAAFARHACPRLGRICCWSITRRTTAAATFVAW